MMRNENNILPKRTLETALSIVAGFSFYILCMILPMVGPAGSRVPHAMINKVTFVLILMLTLGLSVAAVYLSAKRRKRDGGRLARFPIGLIVTCVVFLTILLFNGFAI